MQIWAFVVAGVASWFQPAAIYGDGAHICAMNVLPPSTHIEIVDDDNHRSTDCVVVGTGPFVPGRVLDVSPSVRDALDMTQAGTAHVRVYRVAGRLPDCKLLPLPATCKAPPPHLCVLELPKPALLDCSR